MGNEKAVLCITINKPVVGREQDAIDLWLDTPGWLDEQQLAGWFQRFDGFWLTAQGATVNSSWLCYGERAKLDEWRRSEDFEAWVSRTQLCMEDLTIAPGVTTDAMRPR
jgi:hypothetical protein